MLTQQKCVIVIVAFIQSTNTRDCNDVSYFGNRYCDLENNHFRWKLLFHFWNNGSNWYHNWTLREHFIL